MLRLILYLLLLAVLATGLAWLADQPGSVTVEWFGYQVRTSAFIAAILLVLVIIPLFLAGWLNLIIWTLPRRLLRKLDARRGRIGMEAIRRGIFAAGAGDPHAAARAAATARKMLPEEPLTLLLQAQSAQLIGDGIAARQSFERMLAVPEMTALALRGLFIEAKRAGELEAAKQFAEKSLAHNPSAPWPSLALFDLQVAEGDWRGALRTLSIARQYRHLDREDVNRRKALVLTALARELEETEPSKALDFAMEAHGIAPALVPAAVIAGRILAAQGSTGRAQKVLAQTWKHSPHPDIALIYAHARPGDSPRERLTRVKALVASSEPSAEADIAVATAAVEAKDWETARQALAPRLAAQPSARVCILMARIEAGQNRDKGRAREWLARAARAAPDPAWVASDGSVSREWLPVTPAGALGDYQWRVPRSVEALEAGEKLWAEVAAFSETAEEGAPAPAEAEVEQASAAAVTIEHEPAPASAEMNSERAQVVSVPATFDEPARAEQTLPARVEASEKGDAQADGRAVAEIASRQIAAAEPQQKPKPRQPSIFIPGPAPDDPGPRNDELEDAADPLSRFRHPL